MTKIPKLKDIMTPFPYSIDIEAKALQAKKMMTEHKIRHLPVTKDSKPMSIVSDRELNLVFATLKDNGERQELTVEDVCAIDAYIVDIDEPVESVLLHLAKAHIGSALITKQGRLAGIFTNTDACKHFSEFLLEFKKEPEPLVS